MASSSKLARFSLPLLFCGLYEAWYSMPYAAIPRLWGNSPLQIFHSAKTTTLLTSGTSFAEDNFSMKWGGGDGLGMIQMHYIYCVLYFIFITSALPQVIRH